MIAKGKCQSNLGNALPWITLNVYTKFPLSSRFLRIFERQLYVDKATDI